MTLVWTREALEKLGAIEEFISTNNPERAELFIDYLIKHGESIALNPKIGRSVPEISNPDIREIIAKKYRIVYKVTLERVQILTVFEGHKLLKIDELIIDL